MKVIYSDQQIEGVSPIIPSMFLVGPTPRSASVPSWRPEALDILENQLKFDGVVLVPERKNWASHTYLDQVEWEYQGLHSVRWIVAWVPRNLETMPAFTTNVEFGYYVYKFPHRFFYGRPMGAPHTGYLDWLYAKETRRIPHYSLLNLLSAVVLQTHG